MRNGMIEFKNGTREWYRNGELHREDGPAIEHSNGYCVWYRNGKLHREDGPAIELLAGGREWYRNGERHRLDGPALADADRVWWLNGIEYTKEEYKIEMRLRKWRLSIDCSA